MVRIVTDSVCDLPPEIVEELGITVVSLYVNFGTDSYRDRIDLISQEFYRKLVDGTVFPTTSVPAPDDFTQAYDRLASETDSILAIHLSAKLSGTFDSSLQGKEQRKNQACRVQVIDSLTAAMAQGLIVIAAAEEARAGKSLEQIADMVRNAIPKTHLWGCFDTLEYLKRGGRIGKAAALLGSLLKINPIITLKDGEVEPAGRERNRAKALERLYSFAAGYRGRIRKLAVEYADYGTTPEEAERLIQRLTPLLPSGEQVYVSHVSPVLGAHTGPGIIVVSVLEK